MTALVSMAGSDRYGNTVIRQYGNQELLSTGFTAGRSTESAEMLEAVTADKRR